MVQDCPTCGRGWAVPLVRASTDSYFRYYGCLNCGHVWGVHKDSSRVIHHVTPLEKPDGPPVE